jgi:hypothetical protein
MYFYSFCSENVSKTLNAFKPKSWIQVIFVWTQSARKLDLHVDGVEVLSYTFTSAVDGSLSAGNRLEIHSAEHSKFLNYLFNEQFEFLLHDKKKHTFRDLNS